MYKRSGLQVLPHRMRIKNQKENISVSPSNAANESILEDLRLSTSHELEEKLTAVTEMSGDTVVFPFVAFVLDNQVQQRGRNAEVLTTLILPKVATNLTNAVSSKELIRNMLARAINYAKHNCTSYEKDRVP